MKKEVIRDNRNTNDEDEEENETLSALSSSKQTKNDLINRINNDASPDPLITINKVKKKNKKFKEETMLIIIKFLLLFMLKSTVFIHDKNLAPLFSGCITWFFF